MLEVFQSLLRENVGEKLKLLEKNVPKISENVFT